VKQILVQILVGVANIHLRTMKTEAEIGFMRRAIRHELAGPKV